MWLKSGQQQQKYIPQEKKIMFHYSILEEAKPKQQERLRVNAIEKKKIKNQNKHDCPLASTGGSIHEGL